MNISQHSFCPLGFIRGGYYSDNMIFNSSINNCTSLSPAHGSSILLFVRGQFRFWSPLVKGAYAPPDVFPIISFVDFPKSVFLFSVSFNSSVPFVVLHINF